MFSLFFVCLRQLKSVDGKTGPRVVIVVVVIAMIVNIAMWLNDVTADDIVLRIFPPPPSNR